MKEKKEEKSLLSELLEYRQVRISGVLIVVGIALAYFSRFFTEKIKMLTLIGGCIMCMVGSINLNSIVADVNMRRYVRKNGEIK